MAHLQQPHSRGYQTGSKAAAVRPVPCSRGGTREDLGCSLHQPKLGRLHPRDAAVEKQPPADSWLQPLCGLCAGMNIEPFGQEQNFKKQQKRENIQ